MDQHLVEAIARVLAFMVQDERLLVVVLPLVVGFVRYAEKYFDRSGLRDEVAPLARILEDVVERLAVLEGSMGYGTELGVGDYYDDEGDCVGPWSSEWSWKEWSAQRGDSNEFIELNEVLAAMDADPECPVVVQWLDGEGNPGPFSVVDGVVVDMEPDASGLWRAQS